MLFLLLSFLLGVDGSSVALDFQPVRYLINQPAALSRISTSKFDKGIASHSLSDGLGQDADKLLKLIASRLGQRFRDASLQPIANRQQRRSHVTSGMRSTLPVMTAARTQAADGLSASAAGLGEVPEPLTKGLRNRGSRVRSNLAMMLSSVHPSDTLPGFAPGIRQLRDDDPRRQLRDSDPDMSAVATLPSVRVESYPNPDAAPVHIYLETRSLDSLTEDERRESLETFGLDFSQGNPLDPSYDPDRMEDMLFIAKDRDGSMIGFLYGKRMDEGLWWLDKFMVVAERTGEGIGTQLTLQFIDYIVNAKNAKAFFSSTQVHRIASLKAQHSAYNQFLDGLPFATRNSIVPAHGVGYYHFDPEHLENPPSALVVFPLSNSVRLTHVSAWRELIVDERFHPTAAKSASNFREFLETEGFNDKFRTGDPVKVVAGILKEEGCPENLAEELGKSIVPMVDSLDWGI
jgi:hypothetical protein